MKYDVIVVGGGPAGMMAAHTAALYGKQVLLLERNQKLGKKLLITGKGRCNVTNHCDVNTLISNITANGRFLYSAANGFTPEDVIAYFENAGLPLKTERGNRVFPVSDRAGDVAAVLEQNLRQTGVVVETDRVQELLLEQGKVLGVKGESNQYLASNVIVATGGKSYPGTGSTGDGYGLAQQAGHKLVEPNPSLVPVITKETWCKEAQGLSLKNVTLTLTEKKNHKVLFQELGEMLFTHFGVSGPLVLSASAHMRDADKSQYQLSIDLKPGLDFKQLDHRLLRDFAANVNRDFGNSLGALLPRKLIPIIVRLSGIPYETKVNQITREMRQHLCELIKNLPLTPAAFRPIQEAIVTAGGVDVSQVNPKTMESKLVSGLYFVGEVLDLDAYTGGFNLQIAFSTGYAAGKAIGESWEIE
ncbi:MAG: NAD(P)/FAD-dependent oxidoreductase [Massiliimalia sp.]|jgi:predicted Rossmann fold flavoprotein